MRAVLAGALVLLLCVSAGCAGHSAEAQVIGVWEATTTMPLEGRSARVYATLALAADHTAKTTDQAVGGTKVYALTGTWSLSADNTTVYLRLRGSDSGTQLVLESGALRGANGVVWHRKS